MCKRKRNKEVGRRPKKNISYFRHITARGPSSWGQGPGRIHLMKMAPGDAKVIPTIFVGMGKMSSDWIAFWRSNNSSSAKSSSVTEWTCSWNRFLLVMTRGHVTGAGQSASILWTRTTRLQFYFRGKYRDRATLLKAPRYQSEPSI